MLFFVAKGTGHAAAAAGDDMDGSSGNEPEQFGRRTDTDEGLLVTVSMEPDIGLNLAESLGTDPSGADLPEEELVE